MHRGIETGAFLLGVLLLAAYGLAETLSMLGWRLGEHDGHHGFPWGQFVIGGLLIAPKMLGRATAGKIWDWLGSKMGSKADGGGT